LGVKFHHSISFGIIHVIAEDRCPAFELGKGLIKTVAAVEDVISQNERHGIISDKRFGDQKCLRDTFGSGLLAILDL
jgi:hypothetical protein